MFYDFIFQCYIAAELKIWPFLKRTTLKFICAFRRMLRKKEIRDRPYRNYLFWFRRDKHRRRYQRYFRIFIYYLGYILKGAATWSHFAVFLGQFSSNQIWCVLKYSILLLLWCALIYFLFCKLDRKKTYLAAWNCLMSYTEKFRDWRYSLKTLFYWIRRRHVIKFNLLFFRIIKLARLSLMCLFNLYLVKLWFILALKYFATGLVRSYMRHFFDYTIEVYNFTYIYWYFFFIFREQVFYYNTIYASTHLLWLIRGFLLPLRWIQHWARRRAYFLNLYMNYVYGLYFYRSLIYKDPKKKMADTKKKRKL